MIMVGSIVGNTCGLCGRNEDGRLAFRSTFPLPSVYSAELFKGFIDSWKVEYEDALITVERDEGDGNLTINTSASSTDVSS